MTVPERADELERALRPWRQASALIAVVQQLAVPVVFLLVFIGDESNRTLAYTLAGAVLVLEATSWAIAQQALRRVPTLRPQEVYASRPLGRSDRRLVVLGLVSLPIVLVMIVGASPSMFEDDPALAALVLCVAGVPGYVALLRVWHHKSWLAVSWLPSLPRAGEA